MQRAMNQKVKMIVGPTTSRNDASYKPSFLTDQELKHLVLEVLLSCCLFFCICIFFSYHFVRVWVKMF